MNVRGVTGLLVAGSLACGVSAQELVGIAELPAETFVEGPTSGQFIDEANGITPPFENKQPVQGISELIPSDEPGTYLALSDNGFGGKHNSADYLLAVYRVTPEWKTAKGGSGEVSFELAFNFSDPDKKIPWEIVADMETYPDSDIPVDPRIKEGRLLTGYDFDPESFRQFEDNFWVGEEFGPFVLRFDDEGQLLEAPIGIPGEGMHSPDHPTKDPEDATIKGSSGFEAMFEGISLNPGTMNMHVMLERPREGEAAAEIFGLSRHDDDRRELVLTTAAWEYVLPDDADAIGAAIVAGVAGYTPPSLLIIERDGKQGHAADWKRIALAYPQIARDQWLPQYGREEFVNLLEINDPDDLDADHNLMFTFPFITIESLLTTKEGLIVVNDNNFPFSNGRGGGEPDATEFILLKVPDAYERQLELVREQYPEEAPAEE